MTGILDRDMLQEKSETGAATRAVTGDDLSSNQLEKLTGKDSVMRQRAESYGKNYATSRGLLDSSIGAQATFGAFVDRATPLAIADAERYAKVADNNLEFENQFNLADKNFGQQGLLQKDNQTFVAGESGAERAWRSGENAIDRIHQGSMLDKELSFTGGQKSLDRQLTKDQINADERRLLLQSKADLEKLGISMEFDKYQLNASTQNQIQTMLYNQILAIQSDPNLDPASKEIAILNATDAANNRAKVVADAMGTSLVPKTGGGFNSDRASDVLVDEAAKLGYTNPSLAELNMALEYAKANNLNEQQMRAYVRDRLTPQPSQPAPSQPAPSQPAEQSQDLISLAAQYGYSATAEEAAQVAAYAAANGLSAEEVVMQELRSRGLA